MAASSAPKQASRFSRYFWHFMGASAFVTVPVTFYDKIGYPAVVIGSSMEPTLYGNDARWWKRDFVWISRLGLRKLSKYDIVVFTCPRDPKSVHVKRITATEGKVVRPKIGPSFLTVPEECIWVQSDNPKNHNDSNTYGPVQRGLLKGRVTRILWPLERSGKLSVNPPSHFAMYPKQKTDDL
ncbi:hypothetical protein L596_023807 [Steinernema carpocapsae]|uniref:Mitochondrial inner membrane protease subunit 2 n=1 Tax=Steinernema carpocapsae TaxID=34508 RepID=A0A4U5MES3_STECR|nr:hypothetical protein L596_023807 [Steinernema carpocapsae]